MATITVTAVQSHRLQQNRPDVSFTRIITTVKVLLPISPPALSQLLSRPHLPSRPDVNFMETIIIVKDRPALRPKERSPRRPSPSRPHLLSPPDVNFMATTIIVRDQLPRSLRLLPHLCLRPTLRQILQPLRLLLPPGE